MNEGKRAGYAYHRGWHKLAFVVIKAKTNQKKVTIHEVGASVYFEGTGAASILFGGSNVWGPTIVGH